MKSILAWLAAACIALLCASSARAQTSEPTSAPSQASQADQQALKAKRAKVRKRIRALRAWKLTEELELDQNSAAKLFPILNRYDEKFEAVFAERRNVRQQMHALVESGATDAETEKRLNQQVDRFLLLQQKLWQLQQARFRDVRAVLTAQQAAQMVSLLPAIDRKIRRQITRALRGKRRAKNPLDQPRRRRRGLPRADGSPGNNE